MRRNVYVVALKRLYEKNPEKQLTLCSCVMIHSLQMSKKYFFELIHKQDDHGTDHIEVAVSALSNGCVVIYFC